MKVREAMQQMREAGLSEQDIFGAISRNPEAMARFKAEDEEERVDKLMSRKLPGGTENLPNQARKMRDDMSGWNTMGSTLMAGVSGANDAVSRAANTATAGAFNAVLERIEPGSTRGQNELPALVKGTADAAAAFEGPVARALGPIGNRVGSAITSRLPTTGGAISGAARFVGNVGAGAAAGGATSALPALGEELKNGFPQGSAVRIVGATGAGAALGAGGQLLAQTGSAIQNTLGAKARRLAAAGVADARANPSSAESRDILSKPQGGQAARAGMDAQIRDRYPVDPAYAAARAQAQNVMVDARPLLNEMVQPGGKFAFQSELAPLRKKAVEIAQQGQRGPNGEVLIPATVFNEIKQAVGRLGIVPGVDGTPRALAAPVDAVARRLNAETPFGVADQAFVAREAARRNLRRGMGMNPEPSEAGTASDERHLENLLQPHYDPRYSVTGNIKTNASALSGTRPVQALAREAESLGGAMSAAPAQAGLAQTLQQWIAASDEQRKASMIGTIFSKQKESQNGVRQPNSDAPGP